MLSGTAAGACNLLRLGRSKIPVGKMLEMGLDFVGCDRGRKDGFDLSSEVATQLALRDSMSGFGRKGFMGLVVETSEEAVLEAVPHIFTRAHRIGKRQQGEKIHVLGLLAQMGMRENDRAIIQVSALRNGGHGQMLFDEETKSSNIFLIESEPFPNS